MSVRLSALNMPVPAWSIFIKMDIFSIFLKSVEKIQVYLQSDKNNGKFTWKLYVFMITVRSSYNEKFFTHNL